jgi:hypothetical protein
MSAKNEIQTNDAWLRHLFFALALLYVLPFWTVRYLPTWDGPCHTYNAWILRQYGNTAEYPLFQQYYEINAKPYPNWTSQGTMALLMFVVPPLIAEKLLVSGCVLLFLSSVWYLAASVRPGEGWPAFLAFPFAYHQLFQYGFYNFSISLALFLFVLGYWWRNRPLPGRGFAIKINLLLWLCYFSHILSFLLALAAIGVLWLATLRRGNWRGHLLHIAILTPQIALPLWFFWIQRGGEVEANWSLPRLVKYFVELEVLLTFDVAQRWFGMALAVVFLLLLVLTLRREIRRRTCPTEADAFLLLALLCLVLFFLSPAGLAGGGLLKQRLSLYPYLLLIAWLSPGLGETAKRTGAAVLALAALLNLGFLVHGYQVRGRELEKFLAWLDPVRPNSRALSLLFQRNWPTDYLGHAMGYKALEKGLIDWDNYEAKTAFFPTRFRGSVAFPDIKGFVADPGSLRVAANRDRIDAVYTWQMPPHARLRKRLRKSYELISWGDGAELWERRRKVPGEGGGVAPVSGANQGSRPGVR